VPESKSSLLQWKPVAAPVPTVLRGRYVSLEPLNAQRHAEALWQAVHGHDELWDYLFDGPFATEADLRMSIEQKEAANDALFLAIVPVETAENAPGNSTSTNTRDGFVTGHHFSQAETVAESTRALAPEGSDSRIPRQRRKSSAAGAAGYASFMRIEPAHGVVEVGNILLSPALQRTTAATEAMYLMTRHVFEDLGYRRYEWKCNAENQPSRRAALRLGFTFEGIFRQHMIIKDMNRDTAWFSMLDHEWPARKRAFESWLNPANFDDEGKQRQTLSEIAAAQRAS
jgi:RimJ/RimL family protein N-acetyltransferase